MEEPHRFPCEKGSLDQDVSLAWIMPLEVDVMKVRVIREKEEGKAEKEGRAADQYFKRNQLTRGLGMEQGKETHEDTRVGEDTSSGSQPNSSNTGGHADSLITNCILRCTTNGCPMTVHQACLQL